MVQSARGNNLDDSGYATFESDKDELVNDVWYRHCKKHGRVINLVFIRVSGEAVNACPGCLRDVFGEGKDAKKSDEGLPCYFCDENKNLKECVGCKSMVCVKHRLNLSHKDGVKTYCDDCMEKWRGERNKAATRG